MVIDRIQKLITFNVLIHPNAENIVGMLLLSLVGTVSY